MKNPKKNAKQMKIEKWTENDDNRLTACHEFAYELSNLLRVYISPKKAMKLAKKLYAFVEDENRRFEGFKEAYPSGVSADYLDADPSAKIIAA